jgi:glucokinase
MYSKKDIVLGIDVGGTFTKFGFVDKEGKFISESSISTNASEPAELFFSRLFIKVDEMFSLLKPNYNLAGIGIGAPNANYYKGTVEQPPNLNWGTVNIVELVESYYPVPAAITNDANAAAIGEMLFGAAQGMKDFIVITLGTGLGSGIVSNGKLIYGHDGFAGEIGHTIYDPDGRDCGCGRKGCLETYASASGIKRTVTELLALSNLQSELRDIPNNLLTAKMIHEAALRNDRIALEAFDFTGKVLGLKLADSVAHLSPEAVILFGGLALAGDLIFRPTQKYLEENLLNIFKNKVKLLPSGLTEGNSAILGAGALIWSELEKLEVY